MKKTTAALLTGSALLLASCTRDTAPAAQQDNASGRVVEVQFDQNTGAASYRAWSGGVGQVIASVGGNTLVQSELKADGSFNLTLPRPDASLLTPLDPNAFSTELPSNCTGNLSGSGATEVNAAVAVFSVQAQQSGLIAPATLTATASEVGVYVYYDKAVSLTGKVTCVENNVTTTGDIDARFSVGWNKLSLGFAETPTGPAITYETGTVPGNWVYSGPLAASPLRGQALQGQGLKGKALDAMKALHLPFLR